MWCCIFPLQLLFTLPVVVPHSPGYEVRGPERYTALLGDLTAEFLGPPGELLRVTLLSVVHGQDLPLVRRDVRPGPNGTGVLEFPCGLVDRAGTVAFLLSDRTEERQLARSPRETSVAWPPVAVHVPLEVEALAHDVDVHLSGPGPGACSPRADPAYPVLLQLAFRGGAWQPDQAALHSQSLPTAWWTAAEPLEVSLPCGLFDRAGLYQVEIRAGLTSPQHALIARSAPLRARWSPKYSVKPEGEPGRCSGAGLRLLVTGPRCAGSRDRVRIEGGSPPAHLREIGLPPGSSAVLLPCQLFHPPSPQYCFSYISVARSGAVAEHSRHCVASASEPERQLYSWGPWSAWSACLAPCGPRAVRSRYRLCERGACPRDNATQEEACPVPPCPDELPTTTTEPAPAECQCGCEINVTDTFSLPAGTERCAHNPLRWVLRAEGHPVLEFEAVSLSPRWVIVRDGTSSLGPVLAVVAGTDKPPRLRASQDAVLLELHRPEPAVPLPPIELVVSLGTSPRSDIVRGDVSAARHPLSPVHLALLSLGGTVLSVVTLLAAVYLARRLQTSPPLSSTVSEAPTSSSELSGHVAPPPTPALRPPRSRPRRPHRESTLPLTGSLSEFSMSEDGFEYDYYDYGFKAEPGSFFAAAATTSSTDSPG